jgi:hypothetical protein
MTLKLPKQTIKYLYGWSLGVCVLLCCCTHKAEVPAQPAISFNKQVKGIIVSNCAQSGCHDGTKRPNLTDYAYIVQNVTPGDANGSRLFTEIVNRKMPPSQPLADPQVLLIYIWIMQGAQNN